MVIEAPVRKRYSFGEDVCDWIETHIVQPSGENIGQPFELLPWQREWINELFACDEDGTLTYRWALLGIPKKNGKSTLIAALALYHLLGDPNENDPWAVCAAASDRQADIVFNSARKMCELSPTLKEATERYRWEIRPKGAPGKLERVAASSGRLDGKNISLLVVDELHEWTLENWTILTNGTVGRRRAQIIQITTAGYDTESICYREYEKGQKVLKGEIELPTYLFRWYGAPEGCDHRDPKVWEASNPSYGALVHDWLLSDKCSNVPESQFRRYFLNMWVASEEVWLPHGAWDVCTSETIDPVTKKPVLELIPGLPTFIGWDASTKYDSTAVVTVQIADKLRVKAKIWERPLDPNGNPVEDWAVPMVEVEQHVRDMWRTYKVKEIPFDPAFITWKAQELGTEGAPMLEYPQTDLRMIPATQTLYEAITRKELVHDGDPVLARHIGNVMAVQTNRGGQRITKGKTRRVRNQIDGAVALAMAVDRARMFEKLPAYVPIGGKSEDAKKPEFAGIQRANF